MGKTPVMGLIKTPATAASIPAAAQLSNNMVRTGMPARAERTGSSATAAIALPTVVNENQSNKPTAASTSTAMMTSELTGNTAPAIWIVSSGNSQVSARYGRSV